MVTDPRVGEQTFPVGSLFVPMALQLREPQAETADDSGAQRGRRRPRSASRSIA